MGTTTTPILSAPKPFFLEKGDGSKIPFQAPGMAIARRKGFQILGLGPQSTQADFRNANGVGIYDVTKEVWIYPS